MNRRAAMDLSTSKSSLLSSVLVPSIMVTNLLTAVFEHLS